jgi:CheY-like chemotaxis protein
LTGRENAVTDFDAPRVLVVDDNAEICETLVRCLRAEGYAVLCAADGEVAQSVIAEQAPDVIVTDVFMPRQDGIGLMNWLRHRGSSTPVIAMSGRAGGGEFDGLLFASRLGACATLEKPFHPRALSEAIETALAA